MKSIMKKQLSSFTFILLAAVSSFGQTKNIEIFGDKNLILKASSETLSVKSKLFSGEEIQSYCSHGACFLKIDYKGRVIVETIGDAIDSLFVYSYDFGNDGDLELIAVNKFMETTYVTIFRYASGMIERLFELEVNYYRTVIKKDYIEFYLPSGLESIWHYYNGSFWVLRPDK